MKENILFGLPFDDERYQSVISACSLSVDILSLPDGENTEIGVSSVVLVGPWRLTFSLIG